MIGLLKKVTSLKWTALLSILSLSVHAAEWSGSVGLEYRAFLHDPLVTVQHENNTALFFQPEFYHEWNDGKDNFTFTPFARIDGNDEERSHADIRELSWLHVFQEAELRLGLRRVFWGVTESQHLVDIINQTDLVESADGEEKLGQPMINFAFIRDWGTLDLFVLPYFRERTFPGVEGRLRSIPHVDTDNPLYQSKDKENHIDYALRWSHSVGDWDLGISHFTGTSRDPVLLPGPVLRPVYYLIQQTGLDLQATKDAWLWKLEVINRKQQGTSYIAATAGFEYTFYGVFDSSSDIGLVTEYLYDDRKNFATTPFEDDVMLGLRWSNNDENDTTALLGVIADIDNDTRLYSVEANRRIGESWKLNLEARFYSGVKSADPVYALRNDDFIQLEMVYYF